MSASIFIGTSGWHYNDWIGTFYPLDITGYKELTYHARFFNSVENNSSFYRIASESTYKTWVRMTPEHYVFSMKLNKTFTHVHRLELNEEIKKQIVHILSNTQVLKEKMGAIVIQLPPSFKLDLKRIETFLKFFRAAVSKQQYQFDIAIELRGKALLTDEVFALLRKYNVALVTAQSSRYPEARVITADFSYIRLHGPEKLFASKYSIEQLREWARYIKTLARKQKKIYVYFNNDFYGYAIDNAKELRALTSIYKRSI